MSQYGKSPLIIAHRGASAIAPENTMAAFERAIADGADGIEFDVRLSKDGVPVVFHDSTLQRMAQKNIRTSSLTFGELQAIDVGAWFNVSHPRRADARFSGEKIPTLAQLFDFLRGFSGRIYVELKGKTAETVALVELVAPLIRKTDLLPNIILKSFKLEAVAHAAENFPEIRTAALFEPKLSSILRKRAHLFELAEKCRANELSIHYSLATRKLVETAAQKNLPVTIWTMDRPAWIERARKLGIKAIITNNPARMISKRDEILSDDAVFE
jgi:glycerophosphoryl diester phosphodiesterase